jgi:hypothetical protein
VHLVPARNGIGGGASRDTGSFDHVAFAAQDFEGTREQLGKRGIKFREQRVPETSIRQLFFEDPNRVMVELNFN